MRLWRVTAALAAAALFALLALTGPGSIEVLTQARAVGSSPAAPPPGWARPCFGGQQELEHPRLAFCARVDGRVVYSQVKRGSGEAHLLVVGGFHMVLVELPPGTRMPGWGSRITAVGPLLRARDGQREVQAVSVRGA